MDKKYNDFAALKDLIPEEVHKNEITQEETSSKKAAIPFSKQSLEAVFSKKGRGGKVVTLIRGFEGKDSALKSLGKELKTACGVGGSVKKGEIIIQGNHREKLIEILQKMGHSVKRIGG